MIYRKQVEFAVGHGVSVHAKTDDGNPERAHEVRTVVMPQYEVPVTERPAFVRSRPAMCRDVEKATSTWRCSRQWIDELSRSCPS
jgi:hypothetical protein